MGGSPQSSGGLKAECTCHGGRIHRVLPCAPLTLQVSAFLRIRRKFAQDRHWKNSQERHSQEILAGQGYDSPGFCRAEARRLSRLCSQRFASNSEKNGDGVRYRQEEGGFFMDLNLTTEEVSIREVPHSLVVSDVPMLCNQWREK